MKILVCIKPLSNTREINPCDLFALEEALLIRERLKDCAGGLPGEVDVITCSSREGGAAVLRRAFGMGADSGIHVLTEDMGYVSAFIRASRLAGALENFGYDMILTGIMSQDQMEGETGPVLAEILGIPCATGVVKTDFSAEAGSVIVEREMENGFRDVIDIKLPALLAVQSGINIPRYPSLTNMLAAGEKSIRTLDAGETAGAWPGDKFQVCLKDPERTRAGCKVNGGLEDQADQLLSFLQHKDLT
ncbi:MAG: electron transfer flavoprotein subunit beta/FixA family protein [Desulfobacteraceae bacterium]